MKLPFGTSSWAALHLVDPRGRFLPPPPTSALSSASSIVSLRSASCPANVLPDCSQGHISERQGPNCGSFLRPRSLPTPGGLVGLLRFRAYQSFSSRKLGQITFSAKMDWTHIANQAHRCQMHYGHLASLPQHPLPKRRRTDPPHRQGGRRMQVKASVEA